jgi:large subunit ribosomal protein L4e
MKLTIIDTSKNKTGDISLPPQFQEELRSDLILRAVLSLQSHKRQPYAASEGAGKRAAGKLSRRRKKYRGSYGIGISRVPRKIMTRRGTRMNWVGAFAPGTVGGRRAHPPKIDRVWHQKINEKERKKALRSAIAATMLKETVAERGHSVPDNYPFILDNKFESLTKTKSIIDSLRKIGFDIELSRVEGRKIRSGKGKMRGRKYRGKTGPLIIVSKTGSLNIAAINIPGIDVVEVKNINTELLAPGGKPGRMALWTSAAISKLEKENLFV